MSLVDIYALQAQYRATEEEYSELMKGTTWLDPNNPDKARADQLNEELQIILEQLVPLLEKYKQPNVQQYQDLRNSYKMLKKTRTPEFDYSQKIKDNEINYKTNEAYIMLWTALILGLVFLVS